jgi:hypothetical protein
MVWTLIEPGVAIIASSLATIRPLLRAMKIRGFESTDRTYGTGHSGVVKTNPNRHNPGVMVMPGFGPDDVSLNSVSPHNHDRPYPDDTHILPPRCPTDSPLSPGQVSLAKSEIFVIQGNISPPQTPPQTQMYRSPSGSYDQIHDIEAQSQDLERNNNRGRRR